MTAPRLVDGVWIADCVTCGATLPTAELDYVRSAIDVDNGQWVPGGIICSNRETCEARVDTNARTFFDPSSPAGWPKEWTPGIGHEEEASNG